MQQNCNLEVCVVHKETINWDDVKFFLALSRSGSARAVAEEFGMSHSTISRRIDHLEKSLGSKLFNRNVSGYQMTEDGLALSHYAKEAEEAMRGAEQVLMGKDAKLVGNLHLTTPDVIANKLLMPELASFSQEFPQINLNITVSSNRFDLSRYEADIAIRFIEKGGVPPENLIGRKLSDVATCLYATPAYLAKHTLQGESITARWIGWTAEKQPDWVLKTPYPDVPCIHTFNQGLLHLEAVKAGMGMGMFPCFLAEKCDELIRIPGATPQLSYEIWLLSHPDYREVARLRRFKQFILEVFASKQNTLVNYH